MTAPTFDKWPASGALYESYVNRHGPAPTRAEVIAEFTARHGQAPADVLWCKPKPGWWLAGPVPEPEAPPTVEEIHSEEKEPEMQTEKSLAQQSYEKSQQYALEQYWQKNAAEIAQSMVELGAEVTEAAPVFEGQAQLL